MPYRVSRNVDFLFPRLYDIIPFMERDTKKAQHIQSVSHGSAAAKEGVRGGESLLAVDGTPILDVIDYQYLTASEHLTLTILGADGAVRTVPIDKEAYEPTGLQFDGGLMDGMRVCKNRCIFCFIDQMPDGVRTSLHVKDDDWRMSFIMGNYISLTNVDEAELTRIIARRVSPIYVSLHASDPAVRVRMMANKTAGDVMAKLRRLADAGLSFHLQIVLCPDINDGKVLERTMADAESLIPYAKSLAIVPVGLTRFREGLYPLRVFTGQEAKRLCGQIAQRQAHNWARYGTRFVFLSDEWYCMAGVSLPDYDDYEDFAQIENGVGLLRLFENEFTEALVERRKLQGKRRFSAASGVSAQPFMQALFQKLAPYGITVEVTPIVNRYFGPTVTVSGLITGMDLTAQFAGRDLGEALLIPRSMLRENDDVFLDNMTVGEAEKRLGTRILPICDGEDMIETVFGRMNV